MSRRYRMIAAVSALVVFFAYQAEGALAVFCARRRHRMRRSTGTTLFAAGISAALLIMGGSVPRTADGQQHLVAGDTVRVHIEAGSAGFAPDTVRLVAGRPASLVFTRTVASSCMAEVHIPDLGVPKTALPQGQPVAIGIAPSKPGAYEFRCGMNMRRGTIIVSGSP